jgi:dipeptidyl aminopeptidase/acylaminoacyl peptidase
LRQRYGIDQFLNVKAAMGPTWSPDGRRIAFGTNITGTAQIWSVEREGGWPRQLTFFSDRVMDATYSPTADRLLLHKDSGGNERSQLYMLAGDGAGVLPLCHAPQAINAGVWSPDGSRVAFASNRRNPAYFDLYLTDAEGGEPEVLLQQDGTNSVIAFSPDGRHLLFSRREVALVNGLHLLNLETRQVRALTTGNLEAAYVSLQWAPDGRGLYLACDRDRDFKGLAWLDIATGDLTWLATPDWDVEGVRLSPDGKTLAYTVNAGGRSDLFLRDVATGETRQATVPPGVLSALEWAPGSDALAFTLDGSARPMNIWVYEVIRGEARQLTFAPQGGIPNGAFAEPELVSYRSFDGLEIPAWLYLPKGAGQGDKLPVIVNVHGGPESQSRASFNAVNQYFIHRGYAVLAPNVRGSTGYGKDYTHLDDRRRRMDSVADLAACVPFLAQSGYADPQKIIVMGGSYGGFMTLAALTHYPDLWAAGVDTVGIANLETFLENTGAYRRKLRECEYGSLEEDRDFFREISPIWHVAKIRAPLFVIHGANDPRVPIGEAEQMVEAVRQGGGVAEYLRFEDEGHGLVKLANRLKTYPAVADFLDRHIVNK